MAEGLEGFTDADVRATLVRTLRLLAVLTVIGMVRGSPSAKACTVSTRFCPSKSAMYRASGWVFPSVRSSVTLKPEGS